VLDNQIQSEQKNNKKQMMFLMFPSKASKNPGEFLAMFDTTDHHSVFKASLKANREESACLCRSNAKGVQTFSSCRVKELICCGGLVAVPCGKVQRPPTGTKQQQHWQGSTNPPVGYSSMCVSDCG
jgi:hypothetical protein